MKYMLIMRATDEAQAAFQDVDFNEVLDSMGRFTGSHLLPSVRGELLIRHGRTEEARHELERAIGLCGNASERSLLRRKLAALG
jgi:predicted RNA polymerase sigma factor